LDQLDWSLIWRLKLRSFFFFCKRVSFAAVLQFWEGKVAEADKPLLIKRYASRRLYNTETSDYVTLEDIAGFIREGRDVQIVDLKSGDDLTRQYLLQIIAEHESRGENVLPINVLNDLVRTYTTQATSVVPDFLAMSFDMLRDGQSKMMENMNTINPLASMPGFEAMQAQQKAFMDAWSNGFTSWGGAKASDKASASAGDDLDGIKQQLAELQEKLAKMVK
jgi:polyhydroxyalkanoate synthesis repressor PhaR